MKIAKLKTENLNGGFSLFIAIVVTGALLLASYAISNVASKEVIFANANRQSQYAFFAADAGVECALYWDSKASPSAFATDTASTINCSNTSINNTQTVPALPNPKPAVIGGGGDANPSIFYFTLNNGVNPSTSCAIVSVHKYFAGPDLVTDINSYGYNNCNSSDPRRVERGIEVRY